MKKAEEAHFRYQAWVKNSLDLIQLAPELRSKKLVDYLNEYKKFIEFDLIFMDESNFLYRQKGQLKLDNTILEEFLPLAVYVMNYEKIKHTDLELGPAKSYAGVVVSSPLDITQGLVNLTIKQKDQDFAISRKVHFAVSHNGNLHDATIKTTNIAYLAAECKTNLDKTMFQEAAATALSLKTSFPTAKYYLLCEWLDMTPLSSSTTAIDEVIVLRKAKRLSSDVRSNFGTYEGRLKFADFYLDHILKHPVDHSMVDRFLSYCNEIISQKETTEQLQLGYF